MGAGSIFLETDNYIGNYQFVVQIDDINEVNQTFVRVSGVVSNTEAMEFMQGTDPYVRKGVGRTSWEEVTLERVYNGADEFYDWRIQIENGDISRRNVTVRLLKPNGEQAREMTMYQAWPSRWELPEMDATGSGPATERIVLTVESVVYMG
jgi:phage tail-like protein